ncbi:MAG: hypothetical protein E2O39_06115 [Planctomycetota bacterium]|nr:MAG: hypothetical protein E2O39_06115 [Planctomycetota bacterium]
MRPSRRARPPGAAGPRALRIARGVGRTPPRAPPALHELHVPRSAPRARGSGRARRAPRRPAAGRSPLRRAA